MACATFAAVIPVLGLAGILAREYWLSMVASRFGLVMSYLVVVTFAFTELVSIIGTAAGSATRFEVAVGGVGAAFAGGGVTYVAMAAIRQERKKATAPPAYRKKQKGGRDRR